jgi:undecaprenyl pyrophosphate phosphatase UppP
MASAERQPLQMRESQTHCKRSARGFAFLAGLFALEWLSQWLEGGRWYLFGVYCLIAAAVVGYLHHVGF